MIELLVRKVSDSAAVAKRTSLAICIANGDVVEILQQLDEASLREITALFYASFFKSTLPSNIQDWERNMIEIALRKLDRFVEIELQRKAEKARIADNDVILKDK